MKLIKIRALTPEGTNAINKVMEQKTTRKERLIVNRVCKEEIISKVPAEIHIHIKIGWLAVQTDLVNHIKNALFRLGASGNKDYKMEVE
jgi:hypothetical protein